MRWAKIVLLLTVCAVLRFTGLNWDGGIAAHPDERYIVSTAEAMRSNRTWDPFVAAPDFPYGHVPLYLLAFSSIVAPDVDPLLLGRGFSACGSLLTVALTYLLGKEILGRQQAFLAASMLSVTAIHIQQAHYYTAESLLTTFATCSVFFAVRLARRASVSDAVIAGMAAGLAIGTKASGFLLVLPLWASCSMVQSHSGTQWRYRLVCGLGILLAFAATNPFVLWRLPVFLKNLGLQGSILRGIA
ncbi:MAG: glycosyltransferase family 39 protein, partial [Anaerolineae bacterium]|nr:glycosyltransferase family 39 protein [Anaerolineae bacterium]